jgi:hypothetical protein
MAKLLAVTSHFLLLSLLLALPAIADAQCVSKLAVQRVWTRDTGGTDKTTFAPGETIQFAAQLNNSYGGILLAANGTQIAITTDFYNDTKAIDIPSGTSTWTWNATAPSAGGNYTVTVKAYDHFCGMWIVEIANFPMATGSSTSPTTNQSQPTPAWYSNSVPATIYDDGHGRKIIWQNSYIYQHPENDNLYWYAEVIYRNNSDKPWPVTCNGSTDPSLAKEHIRGTEGIPADGDGYVAADETFCSRYPSFIGTIQPGDAFFNWAIFHNVPPGGKVALEWGSNPFSPSWVNPWATGPFFGPPPHVCPLELVTLGTCKPPAIATRGLGDDELKTLEDFVSCETDLLVLLGFVATVGTATPVALPAILVAVAAGAAIASKITTPILTYGQAGLTILAITQDPKNPRNYIELVFELPGGSCVKIVSAAAIGTNKTIITPLINAIKHD